MKKPDFNYERDFEDTRTPVPKKGEPLRKLIPYRIMSDGEMNDYYADGWNDCVDFINGKDLYDREAQ